MRRYILICMLLAIVAAVMISAALTSQMQTFSISGHITVEGRGSSDGVTVWTDRDHVTLTGASGGYTIIDLPDGEHIVRAWSERCLARIIATVEVSGADVVDIDGMLFAGDLNEDGRINLHDAGMILSVYGATPDSASYDVEFDLDGNDIIDSLDVAILIDHWKERSNSSGPPADMIVVEPDSETAWYPGQTDVSISWDTGNLGGDVSINLYRGDVPVHTIINRTQNNGEFTVSALPGNLDPGTDYRIRVALYYDESREAYSEYFEVRPFFIVTVPNELTVWYPGQQDVSIRWDPNDLDGNVSISLYKENSFIDFMTMSTPNDGHYDEWDVPTGLDAGADYRVKVYYADYQFGYSGYFQIVSDEIIVLTPNDTTTWYCGQRNVPIYWQTGELGGEVSIMLFRGWYIVDTLALSTPNDGLYTDYEVPGDLEPGTDYRIRVYYDETKFAFSEMFEIRYYFLVTQPNDTTVWYLNDTDVLIRWDPGLIGGNVEIGIYQEGIKRGYITNSTPNDGVYDEYDVHPALAPAKNYRLRVYQHDYHFGLSAEYKILSPNIMVTEPNSTTIWYLGQNNVPILWEPGKFTDDDLNIYLRKSSDDFFGVAIAVATPNDGSYAAFDVTENLEPAEDYYIRIMKPGSGNSDDSDEFSILPYFNVTQPDEETTWFVTEQNVTITWTPVAPGSEVSLFLYRGGIRVDTISSGTDNTGEYSDYDVPPSLIEDTDYRVRIADADGRVGYSAEFEIRPYYCIVMPAVDTKWYLNQQNVPIHWESGDSLGDVMLTLFREGVPYDTIAATTPNDGAYEEYDISADMPLGTDYRIRIENDTGQSAFSAAFEVLPDSIIVTEPTETTTWYLGRMNVPIRWITGGFGGLVDIVLLRDGTPVDTIVGGYPNNGFFDYYDVAEDMDTSVVYRIRIDHEEGRIAFSDTFAIRQYFTVLEPNAGTVWVRGQINVTTRWEPTEPDTYIRITLYNGEDEIDSWLSTGNPGVYNLGRVSHDWPTGADYRVRVQDWYSTDFGNSERFEIRHEGYEWVIQNPQPPVETLGGVFFINANTGTAVGTDGVIMRTIDGGETWVQQTSGTTSNLCSVFFTDIDTGTAVGHSGTILRTTDGGETWIRQNSGVTCILDAVWFIDANNGAVVGNLGTILHTTNGGNTWTPQASGTGVYLSGVSFANADIGTIVGYNGKIIQTTNGGATWTAQTGGGENYLMDVFITDADTQTIVGDGGTILRTTDGGETWTPQTSHTTAALSGVSFTNANTGTAVGNSGIILHTIDGGDTWTKQQSGTLLDLYSVSFVDADTGTAVGFSGIILRTIDGGITWTEQSEGIRYALDDVCFSDTLTGTAVGCAGSIIRTTDGGDTWERQESGSNTNLYGVSFIDENIGVAVGSYGLILWTTNGGDTWTPQASGTALSFFDVSLTDANTATIVGNDGLILRTIDGGITWTPQTSGTSDALTGVSFTSADTGTVISRGIILRTTDGGDTWVRQTKPGYVTLRAVSFFDAMNGAAAGFYGTELDNGAVILTTDGGSTWETVSFPVRLHDVTYFDEGGICAVGEDGYILRTIDGGAHWAEEINRTGDYTLSGVSFPHPEIGTAVGNHGIVIRRTRYSN